MDVVIPSNISIIRASDGKILYFDQKTANKQVVATHRKGSVTITLSVEQFQNEPIVLVKALVKERIPESAPLGAMFYAVGDGDLSKSDPRQTEMEFRVVPERPSDVRRVAEQMEEAE